MLLPVLETMRCLKAHVHCTMQEGGNAICVSVLLHGYQSVQKPYKHIQNFTFFKYTLAVGEGLEVLQVAHVTIDHKYDSKEHIHRFYRCHDDSKLGIMIPHPHYGKNIFSF